ncbi:hypothetical protein V1511DRAFT_477731 [Dipodascopsis uninucleata]
METENSDRLSGSSKEDDSKSEDEEDSYMTMTFKDDSLPKGNYEATYTEIRRQKERQQEKASKTLPFLVVQRNKLARGLNTPMYKSVSDTYQQNKSEEETASMEDEERSGNSSVALRIMQKMGFIPGKGLGKNTEGSVMEPLKPFLKLDRYGIGGETAIQEKLKSQMLEKEQSELNETNTFIDRKSKEMFESKCLAQLTKAQKVCIDLDVKEDPSLEGVLYSQTGSSTNTLNKIPLIKSVNFLWREVVIEREMKESENRAFKRLFERDDLGNSYEDSPDTFIEQVVPEELFTDDEEFMNFHNLEPSQKLTVVIGYLRERYNYCFWCGAQYEDVEDLTNSCPGIREEDHE